MQIPNFKQLLADWEAAQTALKERSDACGADPTESDAAELERLAVAVQTAREAFLIAQAEFIGAEKAAQRAAESAPVSAGWNSDPLKTNEPQRRYW